MRINLKILFFIFLFSSSFSYCENKEDLFELYKELHSNPELSFQEKETSSKLASILESSGFNVRRNFGGNGVVAILNNGDGNTVMIRADMDGLPVEEKTGSSYASKKKMLNEFGKEVFTMHACGHDIHMTVLIGAAQKLKELSPLWKGTLLLVLQPAEEVSGGARAIIKEGLFKKFPRPDFNLALHVSADLEAGKVGYIPGWAMANVDSVDILVKGLGGHGAYPHNTKDPIVLAAQIINNLQTIVSREISPLEPAVITVGSIHGGTKHNVIPNEVKLQLTIRSYKEEVRKQTIEGIRRITKNLALSANLPEELFPVVSLKDEYTPSLYNDPDLTEKIKQSFVTAIGLENVVKVDPVMGGEDFGMYGREEPIIPSSLFWLGSVEAGKYKKSLSGDFKLPSLHSDLFLPEPMLTINTGVKTMTQAALDLFDQ